jgi:tight adherence protein B
MQWLMISGIFAAALLVVLGLLGLLRSRWDPEIRRVKAQLKNLRPRESTVEEVDLTRKQILSEIPWLDRLLITVRERLTVIDTLQRLIMQANMPKPLGFYVLVTGVLGLVGLMVGLRAGLAAGAALAFVLALLPYLYVQYKKNERMRKFERQLPEALDLVARALRAGHAFSGGLYLVAQEFDDPIGPEFSKTLDEINFGMGVPEALQGLMQRIDCPDLKFFVVSVILQRETGGNLAEILENIGRLMRERFKLLGKVRTLSAEGKFSAGILISLPFVFGTYQLFVKPELVNFFFQDPTGNKLLAWMIVSMVLGVFFMRRVINIKV